MPLFPGTSEVGVVGMGVVGSSGRWEGLLFPGRLRKMWQVWAVGGGTQCVRAGKAKVQSGL